MKLIDYFKYDNMSETCLIWIKSISHRSRYVIGKKAGNVFNSCGRKFYSVNVNGTRYWINNLVWEFFNGPIPDNHSVVLIDPQGKPNIENLILKLRGVKSKKVPIGRTRGFNKFTESPEKFEYRKLLAESKGYTYSGRVINDDSIPDEIKCDYGVYIKNSCGHAHTLSHKNFTKIRTDFCRVCTNENYIKEAEYFGMKFIGFSRMRQGGTMYIDVVLPCGHEKSIQSGNFSKGIFRCQPCLEKSYHENCEKFGMKYLGHVKAQTHRVKLPCGCEVDKHISNIRAGSWSCSTHKMSSLDGVGYIYMYKISYLDKEWLKIGYSSDHEQRVSQYSCLPLNLEFITDIKFSTGRLALKAEKRFHKESHDYKVTAFDTRDFMDNGFSECYSISHLNLLLTKLSNITEE